jgi:hypothetical protein
MPCARSAGNRKIVRVKNQCANESERSDKSIGGHIERAEFDHTQKDTRVTSSIEEGRTGRWMMERCIHHSPEFNA